MPAVRLRALRRNDVATLRRLVQLYIYDLGGEQWDVEADGTFGSRGWHRQFWTRRGRHHFIILVGARPAGFALVGDQAPRGDAGVREISEFFVLRKYRRRGVGSYVARSLFSRFAGRWEVAELAWNIAAQRFWRGVIRRCAVGPVVERRRRHGDLTFVVQHFTTKRGPRIAAPSLDRSRSSL